VEIIEYYAMAYDEAREEVLLFGGRELSYFPSDELWAWDGAEWTLKYDGGPGPRTDHGMAYDPVREVTVVFGGQDDLGGGVFGDTWEWDGASWTLVATDGPAPRYGHGMAYDAERGVVVVVGGNDTAGELDVWEWDGVSWQARPRNDDVGSVFGHVVVYDSDRNELLVHGGYGASYTRSELLSYEVPDDCPCDQDRDGDIDLSDLGEFVLCMGGPGVPYDDDGADTVDVSVGPGAVFIPADVTVEVGDTVHWFWAGGFHNVVSGVDSVHDGNFHSGSPTSAGGTTFDVVFDGAFLAANLMTDNYYPYYCEVHEGLGMVGSVTVEEHPCAAFDSDMDGDVDLLDFAEFQVAFTAPMP